MKTITLLSFGCILGAFLVLSNLSVSATSFKKNDFLLSNKIKVKPDTTKTALWLGDMLILIRKQKQLAGLAVEQANDTGIKTWSKKVIDSLIPLEVDLLALAKSKQIALPTEKPQGGQRPDGRIDSSPENLKDTSRNQKSVGEAGNTGLPKQGKIKEKEIPAGVIQLTKLKGKDFDSAYIKASTSDFNRLQELIGKAASSTDEAVSKFANKYLVQINGLKAELDRVVH